MRSRVRRQKTSESSSSVALYDSEDSDVAAQQLDDVQGLEAKSEDSQVDNGEAQDFRYGLRRTSTREEITQTEDELVFVSPPLNKGKRSWTQYRRVIFILGCVMGVVLAWAFRSPDLQLEGLLDSVDMADFFDDLKAALPSTLPIGLVREAKEIQERSGQTSTTRAFSTGEQMLQEGMSANYPVVMVSFSSSSFVMYSKFLGPWSDIDRPRKLVNHQLLVHIPILNSRHL